MIAANLTPAGKPVPRIPRLLLLFCIVLALGACAGKGSMKKAEEAPPVNPNEKRLAYGVSIVLPPSWKASTLMEPSTNKAGLDSRRTSGERVSIFEAAGRPSARNLESLIKLFLVNQEGTFMPRDYAEKLQPEEFVALAKDLVAREKAQAKKAKQRDGLLDLQLLRENINGNLAISQRMLIAGPDGKPVRLMYWDIYLPNGAGIAAKTFCDPESPGAEEEMIGIVRSLRAQ